MAIPEAVIKARQVKKPIQIKKIRKRKAIVKKPKYASIFFLDHSFRPRHGVEPTSLHLREVKGTFKEALKKLPKKHPLLRLESLTQKDALQKIPVVRIHAGKAKFKIKSKPLKSIKKFIQETSPIAGRQLDRLVQDLQSKGVLIEEKQRAIVKTPLFKPRSIYQTPEGKYIQYVGAKHVVYHMDKVIESPISFLNEMYDKEHTIMNWMIDKGFNMRKLYEFKPVEDKEVLSSLVSTMHAIDKGFDKRKTPKPPDRIRITHYLPDGGIDVKLLPHYMPKEIKLNILAEEVNKARNLHHNITVHLEKYSKRLKDYKATPLNLKTIRKVPDYTNILPTEYPEPYGEPPTEFEPRTAKKKRRKTAKERIVPPTEYPEPYGEPPTEFEQRKVKKKPRKKIKITPPTEYPEPGGIPPTEFELKEEEKAEAIGFGPEPDFMREEPTPPTEVPSEWPLGPLMPTKESKYAEVETIEDLTAQADEVRYDSSLSAYQRTVKLNELAKKVLTIGGTPDQFNRVLATRKPQKRQKQADFQFRGESKIISERKADVEEKPEVMFFRQQQEAKELPDIGQYNAYMQLAKTIITVPGQLNEFEQVQHDLMKQEIDTAKDLAETYQDMGITAPEAMQKAFDELVKYRWLMTMETGAVRGTKKVTERRPLVPENLLDHIKLMIDYEQNVGKPTQELNNFIDKYLPEQNPVKLRDDASVLQTNINKFVNYKIIDATKGSKEIQQQIEQALEERKREVTPALALKLAIRAKAEVMVKEQKAEKPVIPRILPSESSEELRKAVKIVTSLKPKMSLARQKQADQLIDQVLIAKDEDVVKVLQIAKELIPLTKNALLQVLTEEPLTEERFRRTYVNIYQLVGWGDIYDMEDMLKKGTITKQVVTEKIKERLEQI